MKKTPASIVAALTVALTLSNSESAEWKARAQPDLAEQIASAEPLDVEEVCRPTRTVRNEAPLVIPNPGGKTADILVLYYKGYQGPGTLFAVDTADRQVVRSEIPRGRNTHLQGHAVAPNGKYYTTLQVVGGGLELWVYDPATNRFEQQEYFGKELGLAGQTNSLTAASDGLIYGSIGSRATGEAAFYRIDPQTDSAAILGTGGELKGAPYAN